MKKSGITGIVLASGDGSRLRTITLKCGLPKHLLPLGTESAVSLLIKDLSQFCDQIICVTKRENADLFKEKLSRFTNLEVVPKDGVGFLADFKAILKSAKNETLLITVGDIVFSEGALFKFIEYSKKRSSKIVWGIDSKALLGINAPRILDVRTVLAMVSKDVLRELTSFNPESFSSVAKTFLRYLFKNVVRIRLVSTLFNINTEASYFKASEYFKS